MICQRQSCQSDRILFINGKVDDRFSASVKDQNFLYEGYVPKDLGIGGGDYISLKLCLDCGQSQNEFPLPKSKLEEKEEEYERAD